jgi:copper chaperone CopZ
MTLKFKIVFLVIFSFCLFVKGFSQEKASSDKVKVQFKVEGICDMCKTTIENAAYLKGVKLAQWDKNSSIMTVVYKPEKINEDAIHKSIAAAGYDTEKVKTTDKAYNSLPNCCRYKDGLQKH